MDTEALRLQLTKKVVAFLESNSDFRYVSLDVDGVTHFSEKISSFKISGEGNLELLCEDEDHNEIQVRLRFNLESEIRDYSEEDLYEVVYSHCPTSSTMVEMQEYREAVSFSKGKKFMPKEVLRNPEDY